MTYVRFARTVMSRLARAVVRELPDVRRGRGIEPVHRARVSCRRLQTALWLFKDVLPKTARRSYRSQIKNLLQGLGQARDLDVEIRFFSLWLREERLGRNAAFRAHVSGLKRRRQSVQPRLERLAGQALQQDWARTLPSGRWEKTAGDTPVVRPNSETASAILKRRVRKLVQEVRRYEPDVRNPENVSQLHALRIAAKHLRYALEMIAPVGGPDFADTAGVILGLHHLLGDLHDYHVWAEDLVRARPSLTKSGLEPVAVRLCRMYRKTHQQFVSAWMRAGRQGLWRKLESLPFDYFS